MDIKVSPKRVANVIIGEDTYKLRVPTVDESDDFAKELEGDTSMSNVKKMLDNLGLPLKVCGALDIFQLQEILEGLTTLTKKK